MRLHSLEYRRRAADILRDQPAVRASITGATLHFDQNRIRGYAGIDAEAWRRWAEAVKSHVLTHLDQHLEEAERRLEANGVRVHWAASAADAQAVLGEIVARNGVRRVVKGKSMLSEELELNPMLEGRGIEVFETDLGEYVLQLLDEPPSHILGPAIHRSLEDIRRLFSDRFGTPADATPDQLAAHARRLLREAFLTADMGITGGNFVVSETGTLALIENEGNIRLSTSVPRTHVALVGIEKLLPRWTDLAPFLQLTARAATGQPAGTFVSLIQSPRSTTGDPDGPDEVHVIFVDNGRTRVLADPYAWEVLRCVRCGACLNTCPVYRQTGGHAYGWVYSGPLGAVLNPGLLGLERTHPLPFASTLCGACYEVCPVRIDIPRLLLEWRARAVDQGLRPGGEVRSLRLWAAAATRPGLFRAAGRMLRLTPRWLRRALPLLRDWTAQRAEIRPSKRSFMRLRADRVDADVEPTDRPRIDAPELDDAAGAGPDSNAAGTESIQAGTGRESSPVTTRRAFAGGFRGRTSGAAAAGDSRAARLDSPRERVLAAVRAALTGRTRAAHPGRLAAADGVATPAAGDERKEARPGEPRAGDEAKTGVPVLPSAGTASRFSECFRAAGGEVVQLGSVAEARAWLAEFVASFGAASVGLLVPAELRPASGTADSPPDSAPLGISIAMAAAAESGTLLLDSRDGRRTQLLPPTHLIWIRESAIAATLSQALDLVLDDLPAAVGLHSGPSRSADIGRVIVTGVHGPGRVIAAIVP